MTDFLFNATEFVIEVYANSQKWTVNSGGIQSIW